MGYDNECIVNIQSLPGEYFCPVCRTLICPNEALQAQCTHLFCKPCLAYVIATTHACSYDGYLVTEADSKPLIESSKELAETIGKVAVHCLYQRSGCQWQGTLAESTAHCMGCNYGNSPVVCNRCGTQIIHRQVQEHAQICPGIQPHPTSVANQTGTQDQSSAAPVASAAAAQTAAAPSAPASTATAVSAVSSQTQVQPGAVAPTPEQWYQQQQLQYQQYYQQYPGYDPYQQQYQQYAQYQQQAYPQYAQPQMQAAPQHIIPGQPQPQPYMQLPQPQPGQPQAQAQAQAHPQQQPQPHVPSQVPQMQAQPPFVPPQQPHPHTQAQTHPPPHGQVAGQPYPQPQSHAAPARPPPQLQAPPQHQQPVAQQQMPHPHPHSQHQPQPQQIPYPQPHMQPQSQPIPQMQPLPTPANVVSGYQSYPQPLPVPPQQRPLHMHPQQHLPQAQSQFTPQQPPQMHPPQSQMTMHVQQQPAMPPPQGSHLNFHPTQQQVQPPVHPNMHSLGQQHAFQQPPAQGPLHQGLVPPQHQVHAQQPLRSHGQAYMQQPIPGHPHQLGQGMPPQQAQTMPTMVSQGILQQPNQDKMERATHHASMQLSQPPHSGTQGSLISTLPVTLKDGALAPDKIGQGRPLEAGLTPKNVETKSGEKISKNLLDLKSKGDDGTANVEVKEKDVQSQNDGEGASEILAKDKKEKVEVGTSILGEVTEGSHDHKIDGGEGIQGQEGKSGENSGAPLKVEDSHPLSEFHTQPGPENSMQRPRTNQDYASGPQIAGNIVNNTNLPQQIYAPGSIDRGQFQQQFGRQNIPAHAHGYAQPGYKDRIPSQFPQQYPSSSAHQGLPPGVPPHMPDPSMISQRPPAPDKMFSQPCQERRIPESPPHQIHVPGQAIPPSQMRPPGHNVHETFHRQGEMPIAQEPFWPPPSAVAPGQVLPPPPPPPPPPGGVPSHHGFPPKGFEHHTIAPPGQAQNTLPPPHGGATAALGEPLQRPVMGGPPLGAFNKSATVNTMEAHAINRPGVYDGRLSGSQHPQPPQDAPYGQPNAMKMNGMANNVPIGGGMHEPAFAHGLPEDRFRPFPGERFKPLPEERFKAAQDEHFRPAVNRRELDEDLKQFPRPAHLDGEGPPNIDVFLSSSRPLDRMSQQPGSVHAMTTSRPLSSSAPFPPGIGSSGAHQDIGGRDRPMALHEHKGRKYDGSPAHSDHLSLVSEFGRHRVDGLPPLRSPGNFSRGIPDGLSAQLMRGFDGLGPLNHSFSGDVRGSESRDGGFGGFPGHPDVIKPRGPGFDGRFSMASRDGGLDTFDQSRMRNTGSMVRCLICKIDCETVEGLDLHSLTREHQQMAMDVVLSIKKDNVKRHKFTSENVAPFEQANKSLKGSFEKRTKRQ